MNFESKSSPLSASRRGGRGWLGGHSPTPFEFHRRKEGVEVASQRQSKFAVEFHVLRVHHRPIPNMVCAAGRRGRLGAGSGRTKEAENITKVSAASQFARSKRGLVSGPRAGNKKGSPDEQIKLPSTAPCTRLSRVEGHSLGMR